MKVWSKHTSQCQSTSYQQRICPSRPCILQNTHALQAHGRSTVDAPPTTKGNTTCQPHVEEAATSMKVWSKHTSQCQSTSYQQRMCPSRPCILHNTHGLQAHGRSTVDPPPKTKRKTTCQPQLLEHNNKNEGVEQAHIARPKHKLSTKNVSI